MDELRAAEATGWSLLVAAIIGCSGGGRAPVQHAVPNVDGTSALPQRSSTVGPAHPEVPSPGPCAAWTQGEPERPAPKEPLAEPRIANPPPKPPLSWLAVMRSTDSLYVEQIVGLKNGDVVVTGRWNGVARFTAPRERPLPLEAPRAVGGALFVARLSSAGELVWAKAVGGKLAQVFGSAVSAGPDDSLFVGGHFSGTVGFSDMTSCAPAPGMELRATPDQQAGLLISLSPSGELRWAHALGGWSRLRAIRVDRDGDLAIAGEASGRAPDFGVGDDLGLPAPLPGSFGEGVVARLRPDGVPRWARVLRSPHAADFEQVALLADSSVVVIGTYYEKGSNPNLPTGARIEPGGGATLHAPGSSDLALARFDRGGKLLWAEPFGGKGQIAYSLARAPDGGILFSGAVKLPAAVGGARVAALGRGDSTRLVAGFDDRGRLRWAVPMSTMNPYQIHAAPDGGFVVAGTFWGHVRYPNLPRGLPLTVAGKYDVFLAQHRADGSLCWLGRFGSAGEVHARGVVAHPDGSITLMGEVAGEVAFSDEPDAVRLASSGRAAFLARFTPGTPIDSQPRERRLEARAAARRKLKKTAQAELGRARHEAACAHFRELADSAPEDGEAWVDLGRCYTQFAGHDVDARRAFRRVLGVSSSDATRDAAFLGFYRLQQQRLSAGAPSGCAELDSEPDCAKRVWACVTSGPEEGGRLRKWLELARLGLTEERSRIDAIPRLMPRMPVLDWVTGVAHRNLRGEGEGALSVDVLLRATPLTANNEANCSVVYADACSGTMGVVCQIHERGKRTRWAVDEFDIETAGSVGLAETP